MKRKKFLIGFFIGFLTAFLVYGAMFYYIMPLCKVGGWLEDILLQKQEIAKKKGSPKIIFLSGSNGFWGMRCQTMEQKCGTPTVNLAFHAGFPITFYKSLLYNTISSGDTVIMPLELDQYKVKRTWNSLTFPAYYGWGKPIFTELDMSSYKLFMSYGFSYITGESFLPELINYVSKSIKKILPTQKQSENIFTREMVYDKNNMSEYGDIVKTINEKHDLKGKLLPDAKEKFPSDYFVKEYFNLQKFIQSRGAKVIITWPVLCTKDSIEELKKIQQLCCNAGIIIHGNPKDFMFPPEAFSDTAYHLKSDFAEQRTEQLAVLFNTLLQKQ